MNADRILRQSFFPALALLVMTLLLFEFVPVDLWLQDHFYDPATGRWAIDALDPLWRLLFYTGPKTSLYAFGIILAGICFAPWAVRKRFFADEESRRRWIVVLATLASAPLLIASLKCCTHVFCPYELARYNGKQLYKPVFERYAKKDRPAKWGRGFPAGHASGGFALVALAGIGASKRKRLAGFAAGLLLGSTMGGYQMLKGAHFLSHTIVTLLICWIIFIAWHRVLLGRLGSLRQPRPVEETVADWIKLGEGGSPFSGTPNA